MTTNLPSNVSADFVTTLTQAATAFRAKTGDLQSVLETSPQGTLGNCSDLPKHPAPKVLVDALLHAEKSAKQQRRQYPLELLLGNWRLCFTTPRKVYLQEGRASGRGFYAPQFAPAQICFSVPTPSAEQSLGIEIGNQFQLGPLLFRLTGPARYLDRKNLLAFDFTRMQLRLFGRTIYRGAFRAGKAKTEDFANQPISKLLFFAFFLITEDLIAARGRGGGLALWVRSPDAPNQ